MYDEPRFLPAGDCALSVEFGDDISPTTNAAVRSLLTSVEENPVDGIVDIVPSYRSLLALYNPLAIDNTALRSALSERIRAEAG